MTAEESPKNHRVVVARHGGPEVLELIEEDLPEPKAGEVRVKVLAAGISGYDLMFRASGRLPGTPKPPFTLGEDVVGVVDALGEGVSGFEPDQMVAAPTFALGLGGGYTEYVCLPDGAVVEVPSGVDPAQACCLVINYLTARMCMRTAEVREGEKVLVHGAAGGVGSALLDLGRLNGWEMYATASPYNHEFVSAHGATPIDYKSEDFVVRTRELTGDGVDVVFDPIGGGRQVWRSYRALRPGGRLAWFGMAATKDKGLLVIPTTMAMQGLLTIWPSGKKAPLAPDLSKDEVWVRETLTELLGLLAEGKIEPAVTRFPLAEAGRAHEQMERGGHAGKVVLVTDAYAAAGDEARTTEREDA
jgi:NADPH2:quinone reductase